jgi:transcriptional regulator with XRE-family HTH domain
MTADGAIRQAISDRLTADGISHREFARRLGVSHNWVHRHLSGDAGFTITDLEMLAPALGLSLSALIPDADTPAVTP